ncbi:hypothetical protein Z042_14565 [Chania multitudinisentens RB-25]|uniref:Uncharacterized protein n=1 Tax=Chania multitudinisentens RB-25 TaxID=1441930 RepID=W0LEJ3_9GAMM|nr:hypothetical protein [Chania multitudinisentens]AHG20697.1 hypothetical protein Z042_14565 [Chania multitudinisentens RB-25]
MRNTIVARNKFCDIRQAGFRKWEEVDALLWKLTRNNPERKSGEYYSNAYKDAYVGYNKEKIIKYAYQAGILPELLGGVAWIESGGMPEEYKFQVLEIKRVLRLKAYPTEKTSFGSVAMQLQVAARTLGLNPHTLTTRDQLELASCLMEDDFNLWIVAQHLRDMILYDYPDTATLYLTDEQYMLAGIRYNRGTERSLSDFIRFIHMKPPRGSIEFDYISYGARILQIRNHIRKLLGLI